MKLERRQQLSGAWATLKGLAIGGMAMYLIAYAVQAFADDPAKGNTSSARDWIMMLFGFDWLNVLLVAAAGYAFLLLVFWQVRSGDGFDMRAMLARQEDTGKWTVVPGRVYQSGAFVVTTWAFIWSVTHDKMNEWLLLVYVALWAGSRAINQIVASKYPVAPGTSFLLDTPAEKPAGTVTTTTKTEVTAGS